MEIEVKNNLILRQTLAEKRQNTGIFKANG
jgi:hypothetical protein